MCTNAHLLHWAQAAVARSAKLVVGDAVAQKENLRRQCAVLLLKLEQALRDAGLEFGKRLPKRVKQGAE